MVKQFFVRNLLVGLTSCVLFLILLSSCSKIQEQVSAPIDVDFLELKAKSTTIEKKYPGRIEGVSNVDIKAQVSGYLDQIYVKEGDYVQKDQPLFRIKADVYNEQVQNSKAGLETALAAQESAKIELEKIRPLVEAEVVSEVQLKTALANYESAKAQVSQARSALGSSQINADFTLIKAPVSGFIGLIPNKIGNLISSADTAPLTTLSDIDQVAVYFSLSESDYISLMKDIRAGYSSDVVELIIADGSQYSKKGKLEMASGNINASTGSMAFKAIFPNPDKLLRAGGTAKVLLTKSVDAALLVPQASVRDIQNKYFVYVLTADNKVVMKPIEIFGTAGNNYIIKSGLTENEKIALNRIDALNEGVEVNPMATTLTTNR